MTTQGQPQNCFRRSQFLGGLVCPSGTYTRTTTPYVSYSHSNIKESFILKNLVATISLTPPATFSAPLTAFSPQFQGLAYTPFQKYSALRSQYDPSLRPDDLINVRNLWCIRLWLAPK